ncbi:MAG: PD40 domain-containing protein, partial [Deltaproteobacteria bacterium]|nr:PD40 domain-containing protein [Deltaproteobacteria bacterium]
MAKRPADRFANALDFAAAFRVAAGLDEATEVVPALEAGLRDTLLAGAPQPIAEAIAALGAARHVHQARDAVADIVRVIVRYLGAIALACRTRVGPGGERDAERAGELLATLRRRGLTDGEWVELARELTAPFARRRDVFPVPELVTLFHDSGAKAFDDLLSVQSSERHGAPEDEVRDVVERALPRLAELLRALAFLTNDYALVVPHTGGTADRWMGTARTRRTVVPVSGIVEAGKALLIDNRGVPVLGLWPIVQVAAPTPGAPEDVFFLAGKGRHGARLVSLPAGFERHDDALWNWYRDELGQDEGDKEAAAAKEQAPYRGLAAFTPADAGMFFGREREAEAFLNRLRVSTLLAVVGASGAGKSSFVQAGVVPDLPAGWKTLTVRPGSTPIATLATQLAGWGVDVGNLRDAIATDPRVLGERVRAAAAAQGATLLLIADQFEEIFTLCHDRDERRQYGAAIATIARSAEDPVRVILTMRDDFLLRAEQLPALRDRLGQGLELLAMPAPEDLRRILVEPARRHGYELEDAAMADEMIAQIVDQPGALPLLAFAAAKLWEVRDRHFHTLPRKAYEAMGGVGGALAQHAETTLATLPPDELFLVREAFRHLVTSEGTRAVLSRDELVQLLGEGPRAEAVVEKMVGSRLLVAQEGEGNAEHIEVVHEALIRAWPRLVTWRQEDAEGARLRDQLRAAARQWEAKQRPRGHLWRAEQLTEYQLWRTRYRGRLTDLEEEFASAALADAARGRRLRRTLLAVTAVIAVIVIAGLLWLTDRARKQRVLAEEANVRAESALTEAQARMIGLYQELGRQELAAGRQLRALVYLAAAYGRGGDGAALASMLAQAARPVDAERAKISGHTDWVIGAVWAGDQLITASKDGSMQWWRAGSVERVVAHRGGVIAMAARGNRLATSGADGTVTMWNGVKPAHAIAGRGEIRALAWSADGARLASAGKAGQLHVDDSDGRAIASTTLAGPLGVVELSPDGARVATGGKSGTLWIADAVRLQTSIKLEHGAEIFGVSWSPDGKRIASAGADGRAIVWDATTGKRLVTLAGHALRVNAVAWSSDGTRVMTSSKDATARVWDSRDGRQVLVLAGHSEEVNGSAFSPDGATIVTASDDRTARSWDARTGAALMTFEGHTGGVMVAAFSPDGARLATSSYDHSARVWDARAGARRAVFIAERGEVHAAAFVTGDRVAIGGSAGETAIWNPKSGERKQLAGAKGDVTIVTVSVDGRALTAADDGTGLVWDGAGVLRGTASESGTPIRAAAWSRDGMTIAIGGANGSVRLVRGDGTQFLPKQAAITALAFGPDQLAIGTIENAALYTTASAPPIALREHTGAVTSLAWSPDGAKLVTTSADRSARIWNARGALLVTLRGHTNAVVGAAWSPDGEHIVTSSWDRTAKLWRATDGELLASLDRHTDWVMQAAFTPDGGRAVTASHDGAAMLWDLPGGKLLATFAHRDEVNTIAISADGARALTTSQDGTVMVWDIAADRRSRAEIEELVRCRVPFRLDGDKLIPIEPSCETAR